MPRRIAVEASLLASPESDVAILATLRPGELFEVLDIAGGNAWGIAVAHNLVGYVNETALDSVL